MSPEIRILLLDDHAVVRKGYCRRMEFEGDISVAAGAATMDEACRLVTAGAVDVAVDRGPKDSSGLDAIRRMPARRAAFASIVLSMHDGAGFAVQPMRAGALGDLARRCDPEEVLVGICVVASGRRVLSAELAQCLAGASQDGEQPLERLTPGEFEVLRMAPGGGVSETIAARTHPSPKTILDHLSSTMRRKHGAENDFMLMQLAVGDGLDRFEGPVAVAA